MLLILSKDAPLGQLPYLTVLGQKLPQSKTIARYIAHQHNLAGHSGLEQVQADVVVDTSLELLDLYIDQVLHAKEDKAEAKAKFLSSTELKTHLDRIEKIIGLFGSNGFSVGSSLKWSDLAIFDSTSNILELNSNALDNYKKIKEVRKSVEENQRVSGYLKYRPTTAF